MVQHFFINILAAANKTKSNRHGLGPLLCLKVPDGGQSLCVQKLKRNLRGPWDQNLNDAQSLCL